MGTENTSGKLGFKKKFGYAIGQMVDSTGYNVYYFFFLFFLTDFAGIPAGIAGTISLIAIMWDAVTDPIVGNISDNLKSPYGRRRPLMIGATIPYAICTFLLFNNVDFGTNAKFAYFVVLAILFWSCYKTYVIPFFALGAELTDDFNERTSLRAWASVFLQIAVMIASAAPPMILEMAGKAGLQGAKGWNAVGVIFGLIIIICAFICWTCTRGRRKGQYRSTGKDKSVQELHQYSEAETGTAAGSVRIPLQRCRSIHELWCGICADKPAGCFLCTTVYSIRGTVRYGYRMDPGSKLAGC